MATIIRCDMCDKEYENRNGIATASVTYGTGTTTHNSKTYDLCSSCLRAFRRTIETMITTRSE